MTAVLTVYYISSAMDALFVLSNDKSTSEYSSKQGIKKVLFWYTVGVQVPC